MAVSDYNPFAKRSQFSKTNLAAYKFFTIASWLLVVVVGVYYTVQRPQDCKHSDHCHTIWGQNSHRATPFSLNAAVTSVYWIVVLVLQAHYVRYLWSTDEAFLNGAANVGSHFIVHNFLTFGFIMLWVRGRFWICELLLIINLFNLTSLYFRHSTYPRFIHIPIVSAPLAWTHVAILWDGAAMVNATSLPARILANLAIWGILFLGAFFLLTFKDYTMGLELAVLAMALAFGQMGTRIIAFQWIFAWVIFGCLILLTAIVGVPGMFGDDQKKLIEQHHIVAEDRERAPLLDDR